MLVTNHWNYRNDLWQSGKVESTFFIESGTLGFVYWFVFFWYWHWVAVWFRTICLIDISVLVPKSVTPLRPFPILIAYACKYNNKLNPFAAVFTCMFVGVNGSSVSCLVNRSLIVEVKGSLYPNHCHPWIQLNWGKVKSSDRCRDAHSSFSLQEERIFSKYKRLIDVGSETGDSTIVFIFKALSTQKVWWELG